MHWGWKSGQEPDGPAFERNPSELPKTWFVERGREHSSWCSTWGQDHECGRGQHPCDSSLWLPGVGQNEPIVQVIEYTNALEPQGSHASIHAFCERPRHQSKAERKNFVFISLHSKSKTKELPVPLDDLDVEISFGISCGIFQANRYKPVSHLNLKHNNLRRQHLALPFVKG